MSQDIPLVCTGNQNCRLVEIVSSKKGADLVEKVRQIVEYWGEDKGIETDRVIEVASRLYGADPSEIMESLIENFKANKIQAKFKILT